MKPVLKTQKLVLPQVQRYLPWAKRSLFILGFSLITLGVNELSVLAQTRQPTNAEIKRLRQELEQQIRVLPYLLCQI
jgi:cob(I)alamin adenosyltransferase